MAQFLRSIDLCRGLCTFLCRFDPCGLGPTEQRLYPESDITHQASTISDRADYSRVHSFVFVFAAITAAVGGASSLN